MKNIKSFVTLAVIALTVAHAEAQKPPKTLYTVTDAGVNWEPLGVNASGQMAGQGDFGQGSVSCIWSLQSGLTVIPGILFSAGSVQAHGMNDDGVVVGASDLPEAFIWDPVNGTRHVGNSLPNSNSWGEAINGLGHVVGWDDSMAFLWKPDTGQSYLALDGGDAADAVAINNKDQVLGIINFNHADYSEAVVWETDGRVRYLGNLVSQGLNVPCSLNDRGYVCGYTESPIGETGYVLDPQGNVTLIGTNGGTGAVCINNHNAVVGGSDAQGFVWTRETGITLLNDVLAAGSAAWNVRVAQGINDSGQIAATAYLNGVQHAVLLTPVQEHHK